MEELQLKGLAARAWGDPEGEPMLALHGWMDNAASFDRLAPLLRGVRLVALDLPGHGLSRHRSPDAFYHFVDWVPDVLAAADELGWRRFSLLGHSMGGGVAALVAGVAPHRILRLVVLEALGPLTSDPALAPEQLRRSLEAGVGQNPRYPSLSAAVERLVARGLSPEGARCLAQRGTEPAGDGVRFRHDPRLRLPSRTRLTEEQVEAFLRAIEAPTLLIRGREGLDFGAALERRLALVPRGRGSILPGGHHLHLDTPEPVAEAINTVEPLALLRRYYDPASESYRVLVDHVQGVTSRALSIARRMDADLEFVEQASMLHDIGIFLTRAPDIGCYGEEAYIRHGVLGRELLERHGLPRHALVCERHVGTGITPEEIEKSGLPLPVRDMSPVSLEEQIICYADKFFSKGSGGELPLEEVRRRLARHGGLERFEAWRERFEKEVAGTTGSHPPTSSSREAQ